VIDEHGFRLNVGIILTNSAKQVFWGQRVGNLNAWQFPQGGMQELETPQEAMYRELTEELGLDAKYVEILGVTKDWLSYHLPPNLRRYSSKPLCIGQTQKWFLLKLLGDDNAVRLDHTDSPEFASWRWVDYWYPLEEVVAFKKEVYKSALEELAPILFGDSHPER